MKEENKENKVKQENKQKEVKTEIKEKDNSKKSKKKIVIITIVVILFFVLLGVGAFFLYNMMLENLKTGTEWGDLYNEYIQTEILTENEDKNYNLKEDTNSLTIEFLDVGEDNPVMLVSYKKDGKDLIDLYKINNNQVEEVFKEKEARVDYLYDMKKQEYFWYLINKNGEDYEYTIISKLIDGEEEPEYSMNTSDMTKQETVDGDTIFLFELEETFANPNIERNNKLELSNNMTKDEYLNKIKIVVENYKPVKDLVTDEIKEKVEEDVKEIEERKQKIEDEKVKVQEKEEQEKAEEEARIKQEQEEAEKKAAEEAAKKQEEEQQKQTTNTTNSSKNTTTNKQTGNGLTVGSYNLKYGMYTYGLNQIFIYNTGTYRVKNETGNFSVSGNNINFDNGMTLTVNGNNSFIYNDVTFRLQNASKNQ